MFSNQTKKDDCSRMSLQLICQLIPIPYSIGFLTHHLGWMSLAMQQTSVFYGDTFCFLSLMQSYVYHLRSSLMDRITCISIIVEKGVGFIRPIDHVSEKTENLS